jgi:ATP-dependent RNA helicase SUPV3L1/SUV3
LHAALVDRFVERRARTRQISSPRPLRRHAAQPPSDNDSAFRPFLVLDGLKQRLAGGSHAVAPDLPENKLEALIDAPHEAFHFDAEGFLCGGGARLGRLVRGASLSLPDVRLLALEELGAGLRLRLGRRLLAFARDWVGRLLLPLRELGRSERAALRAFAYQLEQGLGTALRRDLEGSSVGLDSDSQSLLERQGVRIGVLSVDVRGLATPAAREQRARLVAAFYAESKLPSPCPPVSAARGNLSFAAWLALGAIPLGPWVLRADLAERAARDLVEQRNLLRTLASLGVPRRERLHVASALDALLQPDTGELRRTKPAG